MSSYRKAQFRIVGRSQLFPGYMQSGQTDEPVSPFFEEALIPEVFASVFDYVGYRYMEVGEDATLIIRAGSDVENAELFVYLYEPALSTRQTWFFGRINDPFDWELVE